jgi:hypothetical protein
MSPAQRPYCRRVLHASKFPKLCIAPVQPAEDTKSLSDNLRSPEVQAFGYVESFLLITDKLPSLSICSVFAAL